MQRLRLKADGRIVELRDGQEFPLAPTMPELEAPVACTHDAGPANRLPAVRDLRRRARLTQIEFAARLGVPVETIRNWEQGKRMPRGPARALLAVIAHAPETVFAAWRPRSLSPGLSVMVDASLAGAAIAKCDQLASWLPQPILEPVAADATDAVYRSQRRKNSGDRAGHLGTARTNLRADRRAGAAARLSPYRYRAGL